MLRVVAAAVLLLMPLTGCEGGAAAPGSTPSATSPATTPTPTTMTVRRSLERLRIAWRADGQRWPTVFRVPFGPSAGQLGVHRYHDRAPIIPSALAVTDDGFWILDPEKRRLCLFDARGRLLKAYPGVHQDASDLALDEAGRPVILDREPDAAMLRLVAGKLVRFRMVRTPYRLAQTPAGAFTVILPHGGTDPTLPLEFETLDNQTRTGLPTAVGPDGDVFSLFGVDPDGTTKDLSFSPAGATSASWETRVEITGARPQVDSTNFFEDIILTDDRAWLSVIPGSYGDAYPGSRNPLYLLSVGLRNGRLRSFERIEQGPSDTTNQAGDFAVHDGSVYQLFLSDTGVEVRRRPAR